MVSLADSPEIFLVPRIKDFVLHPKLKMTVIVSDRTAHGLMETAEKTEPDVVGSRQCEESSDPLHDIGCAAVLEDMKEIDGDHFARVRGLARYQRQDMVHGFQPDARARIKSGEFEVGLHPTPPVKEVNKKQLAERSIRDFEPVNEKTNHFDYLVSGDDISVNYVAVGRQFSKKQALLET